MRRRRDRTPNVSRLGLELGLLNTPAPTLSTLLSPVVISPPSEVRALEDRRTFHPSRGLRPAVSFFHDDARLVPRGSRNLFPPSAIGFAFPSRVAICVRRKSRREVLFATGGAGSGRRVSSRRRRSAWSDVQC